jgi:hypothetical protein
VERDYPVAKILKDDVWRASIDFDENRPFTEFLACFERWFRCRMVTRK